MPVSSDEMMRRLQYRNTCDFMLNLDSRCFELERRLRKLELAWPGSTPDEQRQLRKKRMQVRTDLEIMKIDLIRLERRAAEL